jgi:hypothetical protein
VRPVSPPARTPVALLCVALAIVATACGSGSTSDTAAGSGVAAIAEANLGDLATSDDVRLIQVLEVDTGETTTLTDTVTGDRPVLLWFWAPH